MEKMPYASTVGSLMYAMVSIRPDLVHAVNVVSSFLVNPTKELGLQLSGLLSTPKDH